MSLPDKDEGSTYGSLNKVNYQALPPSDPLTDWDNTLIAPAFCNVAGLTQTATIVSLSVELNPVDGYMTLISWDGVYKNATNTAPICHHVSTGLYSFTLPTTVSDEYNLSFGNPNTHSINLQRGFVNFQHSTGRAYVSCAANVIMLNLFDATGANADFSGTFVDIFAQ